MRNSQHRIIETPEELFRRTAMAVSKAEQGYKSKHSRHEIEEKFFTMMSEERFLPNSPCLMNAGTPIGQLSACFVIPVPDSMEGIFDSLKDMAVIHQTGGGTGFSFSHLRPKGDIVYSTKGFASGPVSFMSIYDRATGVIVQGGRRRGANMGILRCDHPDIVEFIEAKNKEGAFSNFNLSVGVTDKFMKCAVNGLKIDLVNPRTKRKTATINAKELLRRIAQCAWQTGDPGIIFLDEINRRNPVPFLGAIEATNPCGELPLFPYESCNLGSINLSEMVTDGRIDWNKLGECIGWSIRFLDNVIDVNKFPAQKIKDTTLANRKIGLGVMGFADMLIKLGISYNSAKAVKTAEELMKFIRNQSIAASVSLAKERGAFPNYKKSIYSKINLQLRNCTVNSIAPAGSISIIAGCVSGIEPLFGVCFTRNVLDGLELFEINPLFEDTAKKLGIYNKALTVKIAETGSVRGIKGIPDKIKNLFLTAFEIPPLQHLKIQAAFQKFTDNSVSKTINLPKNASVNDVRNIFIYAHKLKCKGITIYRYGSKRDQVLCLTSPCVF